MTATSPATASHHSVSIVDGRFMHAACTCGWRSAGKRERKAVRIEADDHLRLYADAVVRSLEVPAPRLTTEV